MRRPSSYLIFFLLLASCTRPSCDARASAEAFIVERLGADYSFDGREAVVEEIACEELTKEGAVQIALLQSPKILALFEEIGIAEADLLAAGLLANPVFELEVRYPHRGELKTNIEYLVLGPLVDLLLMPLRKQVASLELERVKRHVAATILDLLFDVEELFNAIVLERRQLKLLDEKVEILAIQRDLGKAQERVGNINAFHQEQLELALEEAKVFYAESAAELIQLEESFLRLLGFCSKRELHFPESICLTAVPSQDFEERALFQRLDLQAMRVEVVRLCKMVGLKEWWSYTKLFGGLAGEREVEGENLLGFGLAGEVPLFNRGGADRLALFSEMRVARERFFDLELSVRSGVREALKRFCSYEKIDRDYRERLLPRQRELLNQGERLYNVMGINIELLLETKREEIQLMIGMLENQGHLLRAKIALSRAVGGAL